MSDPRLQELGSQCEWEGCTRPATVVTAWGDTYLCRGHEIVANANADTHGEFGITVEEYRERLERAADWLRENPA